MPQNGDEFGRTHPKAFLTIHWLGIGVKESLLDESLALEGLMLSAILGVLRFLEPEGRADELLPIDEAIVVRNDGKGLSLLLAWHIRAQKNLVGEQLAIVDLASAASVQVANHRHELSCWHFREGVRNRRGVAVEGERAVLARLEEVVDRLQLHAVLIVNCGD